MNPKGSILAVVALGVAIAFVVAGPSIGRDGPSGPDDRKLHPQPQRLADTSRGEASIAATRSAAKVRYLESKATPIGPGASDGYSFTCPKRTPRAIAGYGGTAQAANAGDIVIADSTPFRKGRSWSVGIKNLAAEPREFYVGVVCVG
ncbi:MAG TPA: hypothetical protein VFB51_10380 [Solirubrobacterales bacterium]|nr:hypothetical protein [Solirubrobacterales bacterium]